MDKPIDGMFLLPNDTTVPKIREIIIHGNNSIIHPNGYIITKTKHNTLVYHTLNKWYNKKFIPNKINTTYQHESVISLI
jgi:hypothetical protein